MSSTMTLTGRLTGAPEIRFSASGVAVAAFTIVTSRRVKDQATNEWRDADTTYWDCKAFKQLAENICDSLDRGMEVVAVGRAVQESWEDKQSGQKRSKISVWIDSIGPSLRSATARVTKAGSGGGREAFQQARQASSREGLEDPWGASPAGQGGSAVGGWDGGEPPF
ncbi:single-stranded DNA-binding protein [Streptomyces scabiei]|uniref:single-stranded DNA-binding protein n=1 Tax=Streptomyces scabiei TaxID=1930 RepID=UPI0029AE83DB|nr:single-stranded DNA-binding protein [Streptomyces scabiei]MDX2658306.1 single-stranded DNA-binding protein [Streptomyces scabiei]MDX2870591.1 single-stranded DNA-binding protein [Streptomyces scabiei]